MPVPNSTSDSNKFPIESCRERIARRHGLDAVALSGPCKGANLTECVCKQLSDRWENISNRFAKNNTKVVRLAEKLAESFMEKDDSDEALKAVSKMGFEQKSASNIVDYLHAYAMPDVMSEEISGLADEVDAEDDQMKEPVMDEAIGTESVEPLGPAPEAGPPVDEGAEGGMVSIEIPQAVAEELKSAIEKVAPQGLGEALPGEPLADEPEDEGLGLEMESVEELPPEGEPKAEEEGPSSEPVEEVEEVEEVPSSEPVEEVEEVEEVPGKPEEKQPAGGMVAVSEPKAKETAEGVEQPKAPAPKAPEAKKAPEPKKEEPKEEKREASVKKNVVKVAYPEFGSGNKPISEKNKQVEDPKPVADGNLKTEGHAAGDNKMQDGSTLGAEKKFDAKSVDKSDVSGGSKSLIGKDESFPEGKPQVPAGSAPIGGEEFTGGNVATKGTIIATVTPKGIIVETPEGKKFIAKASIPAEHAVEELTKQISEIKYEGDGAKFAKAALDVYKKYAASKVQMTAAITPNGIAFKTPEGKSFMAKVKIAKPTQELISAIEQVQWSGDVQKYANSLLKAVKTAEKKDEVTTDTSKLEAEKFTNDGKKEPEDDKATKESKKAPKNDEGQTTTTTSELEAKKFTNDEEKKPETKASSEKEVKQAADKSLKNGPISKGNFTAPEKKIDGDPPMGAEKKFDAKEPEKTAGGQKSIMGKDEELPKGEFKVPSEDSETNVMTKGTVIAQQNEAKLREARLKAASIYVADLLRYSEISDNEYNETLEKVASMPIQAIQQLALSTRKARERVAKQAEATQKKVAATEVGLGLPVVISSKNGNDLRERLAKAFSLNRKLDEYEAMKNQK